MERGTMRLRMGVNDTHYAGNLVAGANIAGFEKIASAMMSQGVV